MSNRKSPHPYSGFFVTFEGGEGAGKSTQIRHLMKWLKRQKLSHLLTLEPGGTAIGQRIRALLLNPDIKNLSQRTELLLYEADRAQHVDEVIVPALRKGRVVVSDRYADSSAVYQGICRDLGLDWTITLNNFATSGLMPDLAIVLDLPEEVGLSRVRNRIREDKKLAGVRKRVKQFRLDRLEREKRSFHSRVRKGFLQLAKRFPERIAVVNAACDEETVRRSIEELVESRLRRKGVLPRV